MAEVTEGNNLLEIRDAKLSLSFINVFQRKHGK